MRRALAEGGKVGGRRVARGNRTLTPSRPGESHPEALTDPCLSLSAHTARAIHGELALSVTTRRFLPLPVDQSGYDANDPPPSLHGHYPISSLLRSGPPLAVSIPAENSPEFWLKIPHPDFTF